MKDTWFEIPALAAEISEMVSDGRVKATYSAGPQFLEQTGKIASLWIGLSNSSFNERAIEAMQGVSSDIASRAASWLEEHQLAVTGTNIEIAFADESQIGPFVSFNALETISFTVDAALKPVRIVPQTPSEFYNAFRELRYRLSGRKFTS